jgi:hypothetical protein
MHDFDLVHSAEASHRLNEYLPDLSLFNVSLLFFVVAYFLENVPIIGQFHDNTIYFTFRIKREIKLTIDFYYYHPKMLLCIR